MPATPVNRSVDSEGFVPAWLPPGGHGNGLHASAWAPVADLPVGTTAAVLDLPASAHVPAYVAEAPAAVRSLLPGDRPPGSTWRLWVASASYGRAEGVLMMCLPELLRPRKRSAFPVPVRRSRHGRGSRSTPSASSPPADAAGPDA
ncbi:hypothetical protein ACFXJ6_15735 [Streptomyces sp. NPDC059218]|uniref:hypothetical protein n=1 Tax=unclassified Streptomyces TaxID=2593676 RepID=UPI0036885FCC